MHRTFAPRSHPLHRLPLQPDRIAPKSPLLSSVPLPLSGLAFGHFCSPFDEQVSIFTVLILGAYSENKEH